MTWIPGKGYDGDLVYSESQATIQLGTLEGSVSHNDIETSSFVILSVIWTISSNNIIISNSQVNYDYSFSVNNYSGVRNFTADLPDIFAKNVTSSHLNNTYIPFNNLKITDILSYDKSFINVLFDDQFSDTTYRYMYREVIDKTEWNDKILTRLMINPYNAHYYRCDGDDPTIYIHNLYNLQNDDIQMIDVLFNYRTTKILNFNNIIYSNLTTNLSKMIYNYLSIVVNDDFSNYDFNVTMSAPGDLLELMFETYLVENIFKRITKN